MPLRVHCVRQSKRQHFLGILLCLCTLALAPAGYAKTDNVDRWIRTLNGKEKCYTYGIHARAEVVGFLGQSKDPRAVDPLIAVLKDADEDGNLRTLAVDALGQIADPRAAEPLASDLKYAENQAHTRGTSIKVGRNCWINTSIPFSFRSHVVDALGKIKDPRAAEALILTLKDKDLQSKAADALHNIGAPAVEPLIAALKIPENLTNLQSSDGQSILKEALVGIGTPAVEPLIATLKDRDPNVRQQAADALGEIKDPRALEPLIAARQDGFLYTRRSGEYGALRLEDRLSCLFSQDLSLSFPGGLNTATVNLTPTKNHFDCYDKEGKKRSIELESVGLADGKVAIKTKNFGTVLRGNSKGTFDKYEMTEDQIKDLQVFLGFER